MTSPYKFFKRFNQIDEDTTFVEDKGNHSIVYVKIQPRLNEADETVNAQIVKTGHPHFEFFRDNELIRTATP